MSRVVGYLCEQPLPPPVSRVIETAYVKAFGVDMGEVARQNGECYPSFDAFFTRPLREGARVIEPAAFVSPADGLLASSGRIDSDSRLSVKNRIYAVDELVGDPGEARRYAGGAFAVVYLSPRDYHRVHSPVDGTAVLVRGIPGDLFPVNSIGERHVPRLFVRNQRAVLFIDTPDAGRVAVVFVGALIVGRITVTMLPGRNVEPGDHALNPPVPVRRGDEIGAFHLGSTVVILAEKGVDFARPRGPLRYGQTLLGSS